MAITAVTLLQLVPILACRGRSGCYVHMGLLLFLQKTPLAAAAGFFPYGSNPSPIIDPSDLPSPISPTGLLAGNYATSSKRISLAVSGIDPQPGVLRQVTAERLSGGGCWTTMQVKPIPGPNSPLSLLSLFVGATTPTEPGPQAQWRLGMRGGPGSGRVGRRDGG